MFPADLILLSSANEGGVAYIETASLDGEKNLKPRMAYPATAHFNASSTYMDFQGKFEGDIPDKDLHKFEAKIQMDTSNIVSISGDKQLLYRGTKLKNTKFVFGLVVYTGKNTKIILNSES
jgi:phospholipid-transporting ATPase